MYKKNKLSFYLWLRFHQYISPGKIRGQLFVHHPKPVLGGAVPHGGAGGRGGLLCGRQQARHHHGPLHSSSGTVCPLLIRGVGLPGGPGFLATAWNLGGNYAWNFIRRRRARTQSSFQELQKISRAFQYSMLTGCSAGKQSEPKYMNRIYHDDINKLY